MKTKLNVRARNLRLLRLHDAMKISLVATLYDIFNLKVDMTLGPRLIMLLSNVDDENYRLHEVCKVALVPPAV